MEQCEACFDDKGFCVYCQKQFDSPQRLHTHITKHHKDTIRYWNCDVRKVDK